MALKRVKDSLLPVCGTVCENLNKALAAELMVWWSCQKSLCLHYTDECSGGILGAGHGKIWGTIETIQRRMSELGFPCDFSLSGVSVVSPVAEALSTDDILLANLAVAVMEAQLYGIYQGYMENAKDCGDTVSMGVFKALVEDADHLQHSCCHVVEHMLTHKDPIKGDVDTYGDVDVVFVYPYAVVIQKTGDHKYDVCGYVDLSVGSDAEPHLMGEFSEDSIEKIREKCRSVTHPGEVASVEEVVATPMSSLSEEGLDVVNYGDEVVLTSDTSRIVCRPKVSEVVDSMLRLKSDSVHALACRKVLDEMEDRQVNGKTVKVKKLANGEEANQFLEQNKGYTVVDEGDDGSVYVTLESQAND